MHHQSPGVRLGRKGGVACAGIDEKHVVFLKNMGTGSNTELLASVEKDIQLILGRMPVVAVVHDFMGKSGQIQVIPGPLHLKMGLLTAGLFHHYVLPPSQKHSDNKIQIFPL